MRCFASERDDGYVFHSYNARSKVLDGKKMHLVRFAWRQVIYVASEFMSGYVYMSSET